jgi:hypothetical protein
MLGGENPFRPTQQGVAVGGLDPLSDGGVKVRKAPPCSRRYCATAE